MSARAEVAVGMSSCGIASGARVVFETLRKDVADRGLPVDVVETGCVGACHAEPLVEVRQADGKKYLYGNVDEARAHSIVAAHLAGGSPVADLLIPDDYTYLARQKRIILSNCGVINPESIDQYTARDGYSALVGLTAPERKSPPRSAPINSISTKVRTTSTKSGNSTACSDIGPAPVKGSPSLSWRLFRRYAALLQLDADRRLTVSVDQRAAPRFVVEQRLGHRVCCAAMVEVGGNQQPTGPQELAQYRV